MKKRQKRLKQILSSIHIALDDYDDIFSDFDISSYENRALSQDFLDELKARCDGKKLKDKIKLILSLPKKERNKKDEKVIASFIVNLSNAQYFCRGEKIGKWHGKLFENKTKKASRIKSHLAQFPKIPVNILRRVLMISPSGGG